MDNTVNQIRYINWLNHDKREPYVNNSVRLPKGQINDGFKKMVINYRSLTVKPHWKQSPGNVDINVQLREYLFIQFM